MLPLTHIKKTRVLTFLVLNDGHGLITIGLFTKPFTRAHEHHSQVTLSDLSGGRGQYDVFYYSHF